MPTDYAIKDGRTVFDATTYTGNGSTQTVTNAGGFKPDFVWIKSRNGSWAHCLFDTIRGATNFLQTNNTNAEGTSATTLTSFNSNGFTTGGDVGTGGAYTYVGWQWQAGQGTTSSNTNGSVTSTVSVNPTAGFSIVTYTGTGASGTVGHGLGVAPKMVIVKARNQADSWIVYHAGNPNPATNTLILNSTGAVQTSSLNWNSTAPTSSVFSVYNPGSGGYTSGNGYTYVAYCWAEVAGFSKFGSFAGNASTDNAFLYCGFRPRFLLMKRTDTADKWIIWDSSRNPYNFVANEIYPNAVDAEGVASSTYSLDFLSNGVKIRNAGITGTWIYAAFAENPFKYANAR